MRILFSIIFLTTLQSSFAQLNRDSSIVKTEENAVVYFIRNSLSGVLVTFSYYDGDQAIGRFTGVNYLRYECKPGEHIFWAKSESKSFVKANLQGGKTYFIKVMPIVGVTRANVVLKAVSPDDRKVEKYKKFILNKSGVVLDEEKIDKMEKINADIIDFALRRFENLDRKGKIREVIYPDMFIDFEG